MRSRQMRAYNDDYDKIRELSLELSAKQGKLIRMPEALRRALRTADKSLLLKDAEDKRRLGK